MARRLGTPNMTSSAQTTVKKTPLNAKHRSHGARMVDFCGWDMPVEYTGITDEHLAVRTRAGVFDVSHMGEVELAGPGALAAVQWLTSNDAAKLETGQAQYSALTTPEGTFVDDILVYRMAAEHYLIVVNAANTAVDFAWMREHAPADADVSIVNTSARYALIAVQGPEAEGVLAPLCTVDLSSLRTFRFTTGEV